MVGATFVRLTDTPNPPVIVSDQAAFHCKGLYHRIFSLCEFSPDNVRGEV
jgi:hypothetical protein